MRELFRDDYLVITEDEGVATLKWLQEEPDDAHAVATAGKVREVIEAELAREPKQSIAVVADLTVVKRTFPRATAAYASLLLAHRDRVLGGAFATKSLLLRTAITAATLIPGTSIKGFSSADDAQRFARSLRHGR